MYPPSATSAGSPMRVFALSDIHVDYDENARWLEALSKYDYRDDVLILAGDVSDSIELLTWTLGLLARRFRHVSFVPGNHDLWVIRDRPRQTSLKKFETVQQRARDSGAATEVLRCGALSIVPLLAWYDYSFGPPDRDLARTWMDYRACAWPSDYGAAEVTAHFLACNEPSLLDAAGTVISFSHFLPRIDVMPKRAEGARWFYPVLGTDRLERQIRRLGSTIHAYGHSHVNRHVTIDGVRYVNNAFGYPHERRISRKSLVCIHEL